MNILFDFGHPADVHYFKNLIFYLKRNGHQVEVVARDKDVTQDLLEAYQIPYINKGKGGTGIFDRAGYTVKSLLMIRKMIRDFKPDICISHASPYLAVTAAYHQVPHIMFNDTEGAPFFNQVVKYLKPHVYTPASFNSNLEDRYLKRFDSYMELAYLHPEMYTPDPGVKDRLGDDYVLLRFVANKATHDFGHKHLDQDYKIELVKKLSDISTVWISSETPLSGQLASYGLHLPPSNIHDVVANANLVVSEGASLCSEAAMLGVPSIFLNENKLGYITELENRYHLVEQYTPGRSGRDEAIERAVSIASKPGLNKIYTRRRKKMLRDKKNLTKLMIQIVERTASERGLLPAKKHPAL